MLEHGGRLRAAANAYGRPLGEWLDLSTGINPRGWPVPALPPAVWNRLPEADDGLVAAARDYYGCASLLPLAGSQAAIQALPTLRAHCRVALPAIGYREHAHAWQRAGHRISYYRQLPEDVSRVDVVVVINPNNPSGEGYSVERLLELHARLAARDGWLLLDEAFIDTTPAASLAPFSDRPGLLVLRSVGKFFGLAGIRAGFLLAAPALCQQLEQQLGPWAISHPARWICQHAFDDQHWQQQARLRLQQDGDRLAALLSGLNPQKIGGCALFQTLYHAEAESLHQRLAKDGIWTRLFAEPSLLRFGLPAEEAQWQRLARALEQRPDSHPCNPYPEPA